MVEQHLEDGYDRIIIILLLLSCFPSSFSSFPFSSFLLFFVYVLLFSFQVGGPWIITSYDYDVALDGTYHIHSYAHTCLYECTYTYTDIHNTYLHLLEYGYPNEPKYSHSKQLHDILHQYEAAIVGQDPPNPINLGPNQEAHVYSAGGQTITFLSNIDSVNAATVKFNGKSYNLPKWSVTILGNGDAILYCTAVITSQQEIKTMTPVSPLTDAATSPSFWAESVGVWDTDAPTANHPPEQLIMTRDRTDYLWYQTNVTVTSSNPTLQITNVNDFIQVYLDGNYQGMILQPPPL